MFRVLHLDSKQIAVDYLAGESTRKIAKRLGVGHTTITRRLKERGVALRPQKHYRLGGPLFITGGGGKYLATSDRNGRDCKLHCGCWEAYHGPIPEGHVIHHMDGNERNNGIGNLACMTNSEHMTLHNLRRARERRSNGG